MFARPLTPDPRLREAVRGFWHFEGPPGSQAQEHQQFPQHVWYLDFCSADSWQLGTGGLWEAAPAAALQPLSVQSRHITTQGYARRLAAELYPWTVQQLFGWALENPERLAQAPEAQAIRAFLTLGDWDGAQGILQDWLLRLLAQDGHEPGKGVRAARILYDTPGQAKIGLLAEEMNLSQRQLERAFQAELGVAPKVLARAIRFDAVVDGLRLGPAGQLTTLAYDLGFTDQSHLTREFKAMSLMTPSAFLRQIERRWTGEDGGS